MIKVFWLFHKREKQSDPRLAWFMFHKIYHRYSDINNKEERNSGMLLTIMWLGPAQDTPFFYTPSHLSELKHFKSIISTQFSLFSYLNIARHNLVIELCREQVYFYGSRENQPKVFRHIFFAFFNIAHFHIYFS